MDEDNRSALEQEVVRMSVWRGELCMKTPESEWQMPTTVHPSAYFVFRHKLT